MRVLVVDQDSASNEAIARSLRDLFTVDAVTNKADCLDLLRSNTFEVIVAAERLEDGSGLELLGQIARKWPSVLRIFAADRQRLSLLKGRLGPFELFQTLTYPIDPDRLIGTLNLAEAAQDAHADTTNIQHFVLGGEPPPEIEEVEEVSESGEFPTPQPLPRAASAGLSREGSHTVRSSARAPSHSRARPVPGARSNGPAGSPIPRRGSNVSAPRATTAASSPATGGRPSRHRGRGSNRPPARFPPLERMPPVERTPPLEPEQSSRANAPLTDSFAEAAALAQAASSNYDAFPEEFDRQLVGIKIGAAAVAMVAIVFIGFKLFGSSTSPPPRPSSHPVTRAPQYPPEVAELVARIEAALKADDYKHARTDVDKLREISPSHPRLPFFEGLLTQRTSTSKGSSTNSSLAHGTPKRTGARHGAAHAPPDTEIASALTQRAGSASEQASGSASAAEPTTRVTAGVTTSSTESAQSLAPETPAGMTRSGTSPTATESSGSAPQPAPVTAASAEAAPPSAVPALTSAGAAQRDTASTPASPSASPTHQPPSDEPPPVIREAKLIRRVAPDYPSAAKRNGITGWVDLEVTVSPQGAVTNASVVRASPSDMFDKSALTAVRKWKYDPRFVDGLPSEAHLKVHLEFAPDN